MRDRVKELARDVAVEIRSRRPETIVVTSGTANALLGVGRHLGLIAPQQRHVGIRTFAEIARRLVPLSSTALDALGVAAGRRETIASGAVAISSVLELLGSPVVYVAASGMREGALVDLAQMDRVLARVSWAPAHRWVSSSAG